jgi:LacI family transcriptional regulator
MSSTRVTMLDVAKAAGVTKMTVSRALRNDAKVNQQTREKILKIAERLGYQPDPLLSALASRKKNLSEKYRGTLAWVNTFPTRDAFFRIHAFDQYFQGSLQRANELGFNLEMIWLNEKGMTAKRASDILTARGIRGLLVGPHFRAHGRLNLAWDQFSIVTFGYTLTHPRFHLVTNHQFRSMILAVRQLRSLGYRRISLALSTEDNERVERNHTAAFYLEQDRLPPKDHIPPFIKDRKKGFFLPEFKKWFHQYRPAVVIGNDLIILDWLKGMKLRVPEDVGFVDLSVRSTDKHISGVDQQSWQIGCTAVNLLISMMQRSERGVPTFQFCQLTEGRWHPGKTVRRINH